MAVRDLEALKQARDQAGGSSFSPAGTGDSCLGYPGTRDRAHSLQKLSRGQGAVPHFTTAHLSDSGQVAQVLWATLSLLGFPTLHVGHRCPQRAKTSQLQQWPVVSKAQPCLRPPGDSVQFLPRRGVP